MALINSNILQSLQAYGFIDEFNKHDTDYIFVAQVITRNFKMVFPKLSFNPIDDFADKYLVEKVKICIVSSSFVWFRRALAHGNRMYIKPCDYEAWGEMMARFVLSEAIKRGSIS